MLGRPVANTLPVASTICTEVGRSNLKLFDHPEVYCAIPHRNNFNIRTFHLWNINFIFMTRCQFCTAICEPTQEQLTAKIAIRFNHLRFTYTFEPDNLPMILMGELFKAWFAFNQYHWHKFHQNL